MIVPGWDQLQGEAAALVAAASARRLTLRLVGSAGIRLHCAGAAVALDRRGRPAKDIDLVCAREHRKGVRELLEERGYLVDRDLLVAMEGTRYAFGHPGTGVEIDLFVDRMAFCHTIELRDRLVRHPTTIPIDDLLLQKLQIVEPVTTDLMDLAALLETHEVATGAAGAGDSAETIDAGYVAGLLARDWGFHHTATALLERLRKAGEAGSQRRVERLLEAIEAAPKSLRWRARSRIGERVQWWQDVDERAVTY
jgi:hypothetical protein